MKRRKKVIKPGRHTTKITKEMRTAAIARGAKLLAMRERADLSQADFAKALGLGRRGYANIERGDQIGLASDTALLIQSMTKIPLSELIIG